MSAFRNEVNGVKQLYYSTPLSNLSKGLESFPAGRRGDAPSIALASVLDDAGFLLRRLKTGQCAN